MGQSKKYFALSIETGKHKFDHRVVLAPLTYPVVAPVFLIALFLSMANEANVSGRRILPRFTTENT